MLSRQVGRNCLLQGYRVHLLVGQRFRHAGNELQRILVAPLGITANAIRAGVTDTPALRKIPGAAHMMAEQEAQNPHGRLGTPEDVAECLVALARPETYWMTGNTIRVDGGEDFIGSRPPVG